VCVCVCVCVCEDDCLLGTDSDYMLHVCEDDSIIRTDSDYMLCVCVHARARVRACVRVRVKTIA
jgi:hypothetical protein